MTDIQSESEFDEAVGSASGPVLVLFTSPTWCRPCKQFHPHWEKAQNTAALDEFTFIEIDMGASPEDTGKHWASKRFSILGVPQIKRFDNGADSPVDVKARAIVPLIKELTNG